MKSELSNVLQDADYANASEFYTELFMVREERQRYEEACKEWQQKCVEVELVAVKDSKHLCNYIVTILHLRSGSLCKISSNWMKKERITASFGVW